MESETDPGPELGPAGELSLLVLDLDHFKRVNDSLGHDAGDDVLRRFADVLRAAADAGDVPTRLGGEEFALVLPGTGEARALAVAEHVRLLVRSQFSTFPCPVSVSVGVASRGSEARDAAELMRAANRALYAAKRLGRDRCVVHHAQTLEMGRDQAPPRDRLAHPRARQPARRRRLGARPPRVHGRRRLPARPPRRRDSGRDPHPRGRRRLRGDDVRPPVPARDPARGGASGAAPGAPARSSTPRSWRSSSASSIARRRRFRRLCRPRRP